ncbi:MAG TPA: hypothetical protein DHW02_10720 [Ktedonobacter sp.]|nr:hypothetical protein [Ktedonobacter sp.]
MLRVGEEERATEQVQQFGEHIGTSLRYRLPYLRALSVLARFQDENDAAIEHLQEAARLAEEMGLPGDLWSIQAVLGNLYLAQGNAKQAQSVFDRANSIVQTLAEAVEDTVQRANFVASPLAQQVLNQGRVEGY